MIPIQNIPRASRHCSSYRSLPLGEQQPWGLLLLGLTPVPHVAPSVSKAHRASPSRELCSLNICSLISVFLIFTLEPFDPLNTGLLLGLTACPAMNGIAPLFLPYIRWTFVHYAHSEVRCARTSVFPRYSRDSLGRKGKIVFSRPSSQP